MPIFRIEAVADLQLMADARPLDLLGDLSETEALTHYISAIAILGYVSSPLPRSAVRQQSEQGP